MKAKIFGNVNYIGWIVIILTFILIYFWYFFIYIPKHESQLEQKAFRILKEYGSNMFDKHQYYENHFKNYGLYYSIMSLEDSGFIAKKNMDEIEKRFWEESDDIENVIKDLPSFVIHKKVKESKDYQNVIFVNENNMILNFAGEYNYQNLVDPVKKFYKTTGDKSIDFLLKTGFSNGVPIDSFMNGLKFDELFENIILFNDSNVYYNSNYEKLVDITNPKALCDSTKKLQGGIYKTLNISGKIKHIMILPIDFAGARFCIAGFITDNDYLNKTRTINKQLLIFIAAILLLVFVGVPVLKIIFIDPHERLKANDASGSGISFLFGIGLFILIIIGFSKKQFVENTIQANRIQMISDSLYYNVTTDIDSIKNFYCLISGDNNSNSSALSRLVRTELSKDKKFRQIRGDTLKSPFELNEVILINSKGIVERAVTKTAFSDIVKVNLSQRMYFKNVKDINQSWPTFDGLNFYIESIKSYNTGNFETAVSFNTSKFDTLPVLAITSAIPSLYRQVLPKDIEFVIIDKTGKVLYHSMKQKNLHENFVQECDSELRLIQAINSQAEANVRLNYNENKWLARIKPITDTPLFHITLLDLNQSDNRNAKVFLFTFYFLIASLLLAGIGMLIMNTMMRPDTVPPKGTWFFDWMILYPSKYHIYRALTFILAFVSAAQIMGIFIIGKPVSALFYQLIFIYFTFFISILFLIGGKLNYKDFIQRNYFIINFVAIVVLLSIFIFHLRFNSGWYFIIPLLVLFLITVFSHRIFNRFSKLTPLNIETDKSAETKIQRTYLVFLFLWVTNISAIPVTQYYFSIKNQEEIFWKQEKLHDVALKNVELHTLDNIRNNGWFKRIQGNGIDFMKISYEGLIEKVNSSSIQTDKEVDFVDKLYTSLPDPITNWYNQPELLTEKYYVDEKFDKNTLHFRKGLKKGAVSVGYAEEKPLFPPTLYAMLVFFVFIIIALSIWFLLKFLASVLLNLNQEKHPVLELSWFKILNSNDNSRILLSSFDGKCFLEESLKFSKKNKKHINGIKPVLASQIISPDFKSETLLTDSSDIIWIGGFRNIIYEFDKHEKLLSVLTGLNENFEKRIIMDMPFEIDLINELYDEYIAAGTMKPEQLTQILLLRKKWSGLFDGYFKYNGYLNQNSNDLSENRRVEDNFRNFKSACLHTRFTEIWCNLTSYEKIDLFDLADDGLMNRKNTDMIQKLINKRLIITQPNPAFFSDEFRDFVLTSLKSSEVKAIELKLGLKGRWHNARYIILLILVPCAAFIIISQGISIEKVFGIFAGGLAIITGLMRLFDSSSFKQS